MAIQPKSKIASSQKRFRIVLADDHDVVRAGLRTVLADSTELEIVGDAATAADTVAMCIDLKPEVLVLDLRLPDRSGVDVCREIKLACPATRVLFLTSYGDEANVLAGLSAGADGYLLKTITGGDIADAVLKVAKGGAMLDPLVTRHLLRQLSGADQPEIASNILTAREERLLQGIVAGRLNKEIADDLGLSEKTVRNQFTVIFQKLEVRTRAEAAVRYLKRGANRQDS
jgi:two-component system response regulator DevR